MSAETRTQECDVTVYRCDLTDQGKRCTWETASFMVQDGVTVLLDPAWVTLSVGLGEAKNFCSWDHHATWVASETTGANLHESGAASAQDGVGEFALRLRTAVHRRNEQVAQEALSLRLRAERQTEAAAILGLPAGG